jgi:gliding motility-associated-like protein
MKRFSVLFFYILSFSSFSFAQLIIANQGGTATAVVNAMIGGGLTVSNATITCPSAAYGTFTNGASTNIGIPSGIVLTTGNVNTLNGAGSTFWSTDSPGGNCNDAQLGSLELLADYDCCILEFDIVPACTTLQIRFVFGSEEYPEWVSSGYNDAFGFFVTGPNPSGGNYNNTNVATLPNNTTIVSIDNVNANLNSAYYINNSTGTSIVLDAFTTVLTRNVSVTPCQSYHFKLAIADAGDPIFDSGVFIDFLDCLNSVSATTSTTPVSCVGNDGSATATASAGFPPYTYSWNTTPPQTTATATGLAPGTYTVIVDDAGACTPPITQTVTVVNGSTTITPVFTQVAPICAGTSFTLPSTSNNGVIGIWTPAINNSTTSTYTFTPNAGQCANSATMTVTVTPATLPNFTQIAPICAGGSFILPPTSSNSINGTWTPAINNTATTTYTFTPSIGQCAITAIITVTVDPLITPVFTQVPPICSGEIFTLAAVSNNGISGTWSPAVNNTTTTVYTFTPTAGQCANQASMTVNVGSIVNPTFSQWGPYCQNDIIIQVILPETSNEGITGTWNPAMVSTSISGNIVHTFTPDPGQCATNSNMTVVVNPQIIPTFNQIGPLCQGVAAPAFSNTSLEGINGVWGPPGINTGTSGTSTYAFVPNAGQCATTQTMTITINPFLIPLFTQQVPVCLGDNFILPSQSTNGVSGIWSPAIDNTSTTTYTFTPNNGQCASQQTMTVNVGPPAVPTFNSIGPFCVGNTFGLPSISLEGYTGTWSPAINNQVNTTYTFTPNVGQCALNGALQVAINPNPTIAINEAPEICEGQSTTLTTTVSQLGGTYSWQPGNLTTPQVFVSPNITTNYTVTYILNGCASQPANATVTVNPNIPVDAGLPVSICQGGQITLTASGTPNNVWSGGVLDGVPFNPIQTTVYYVTGTSASGCITSDSVVVTVNSNPIINAGNPQTVCVGESVVLQASGAGINGMYSWSNGATNGVAFTVNGTQVYTVTGTDANGCSSTASLTITGLPIPVAQFTATPPNGDIPLEVDFFNTSQNSNAYFWDFGNGQSLSINDLSEQQSTYLNMGTYTVWLVASNGLCADSISALITVTAEPWIFVPNVFTPNGDNANETWMIDTKNMESIELVIVNRWGNPMAKIEDVNGGWDGKTPGGSEATDGTYFYKFKAKALNGAEFSGHGFLTLIR